MTDWSRLWRISQKERSKVMEHISTQDIMALGIGPEQCVDWVTESFRLKYESILPPKISIHLREIDFFNTMPCLLPEAYDRFSVKVVSRIKDNNPSLRSDLWLYRSSSGELLAHIDADWITAMRTGAVAALAAKTFECSTAGVYAFMGLGNTGHATMECLAPCLDGGKCVIRLLRYKDQAERFMEEFRHRGLAFEICDTVEELIDGADVVISCITHADGLICPRNSLFKPGVTVIPVHTRGFQNCDLFFDKVFADDRGHVEGFRYFSEFRQFDEFSRVLLHQNPGRENDRERILSYNIGLGLHDAFFAAKIYALLHRPQ